METEFEVLIQQGIGEDNCAKFEVDWHVFGPMPRGEDHNALVVEKRQFIEDAIKEKLSSGERQRRMREALEQWKCPACGGLGKYLAHSREVPEGQTCRKCGGNGRHPLATAALG